MPRRSYHETCSIVDEEPLEVAADLLQVDIGRFRHCILYRSMQIKGAGNAVEDIGLSAEKARNLATILPRSRHYLRTTSP